MLMGAAGDFSAAVQPPYGFEDVSKNEYDRIITDA
jgi:hypothetical protein